MSLKQGSSEEFWQFYLSKPSLYNQCVNQNVVFSTHRYGGGGQFSSLQNFSNKLYQEHKDNKFYLDKSGTLPNRTNFSVVSDVQSYKIKSKTGRKKWNRIKNSFSLRKTKSHNVVYLEVLSVFAPIILTYVKFLLQQIFIWAYAYLIQDYGNPGPDLQMKIKFLNQLGPDFHVCGQFKHLGR